MPITSSTRQTLLRWFLLACLAVAGTPAIASSVLQRPIAEIIETSPLVFEGRVTAIAVESPAKKIYTWVTFEILDVIKGDYQDSHMSIRYLGGSAGGRALRVSDQTIPEIGEHGIYFLESREGDTVHPLKGWGQGHFILKRESSSGDYVVQDSQKRAVRGFSSVDKQAVKLNAATAAGVMLMEGPSANDADKPLTRGEFKAFIREPAQ